MPTVVVPPAVLVGVDAGFVLDAGAGVDVDFGACVGAGVEAGVDADARTRRHSTSVLTSSQVSSIFIA